MLLLIFVAFVSAQLFEWEYIGGAALPNIATRPRTASDPGARHRFPMVTATSNGAYLHGGVHDYIGTYFDDLWFFSHDEPIVMSLLTQNTINPPQPNYTIPLPGGRVHGAFRTKNDSLLYLFGGKGYSLLSDGSRSDLWFFDTVSLEWSVDPRHRDETRSGAYADWPPGLEYPTAWVIDGDLFLAGGTDCGGTCPPAPNRRSFDLTWRFQYDLNSWTNYSHSSYPVSVVGVLYFLVFCCFD